SACVGDIDVAPQSDDRRHVIHTRGRVEYCSGTVLVDDLGLLPQNEKYRPAQRSRGQRFKTGIEQQHMAAGGDFTVLLAVLGAHCVAPVVDSVDRVASSTGCLAGRETFLGIDPRIDDCVRSATRTSRWFPPSCVQYSVCW